MNKPTRFPEEFKIEADKPFTERGHRVAEVAARLDVSQHSLYAWINRDLWHSPKPVDTFHSAV